MIKQLRRKFILIMMSIVLVILLAVFVAVFTTATRGMEENSMLALHQALREQPMPDGVPESFPFGKMSKREGGPQRTPTLTVEVSGDSVEVIQNRIYFIDDSEALAIAEQVLALSKNIGVLQDYSLRYLCEHTHSGMRIAFADTSTEREIVRALLRNSILIGASALLLFFLVSLFLASWVVRPVQRAWDQQRQFVANASHELKTPLTVILSNADMLAASKELNSEKNTRRLDNIRAEGARMKQLIESLLTLARSDSVQAAAVMETVDFSDIVMDSILSFEAAIYDEGKTLDYDVPESIRVMGDAARLRQLADILMDNAGKYAPAGKSIRVRLEAAARNTARLSVTNGGDPLPGEELGRIFDRFYRVDTARANHGGFGLGLSIAQGIVQEHGGKIWAESDPDKGNTFIVELKRTENSRTAK